MMALTHPGEIVLNLCLKPLHLSVYDAAERLGVAPESLFCLLQGATGISPPMALRLSQAFGQSPEHWMALQRQFDLAAARRLAMRR